MTEYMWTNLQLTIKKYILHLFLILLFNFFESPVHAQVILSLDSCKQLALENNLRIQQTELRQEVSTHIRKSSYSLFFPRLDINAGYVRTHKSFYLLSENLFLPVIPQGGFNPQTGELIPSGLINSGSLLTLPDGSLATEENGNFIFNNYAFLPRSESSIGQSNNFVGGISMSVPIFTGGKIRAQYQASEIVEKMSSYKTNLTKSEVLYRAETLFYDLYTIQQKQQLAIAYEELLNTLLNEMEDYLEEGVINKSELLSVQVEYREAQLERIKADHGIIRAGRALAQITGLPLISNIEVFPPKHTVQDDLILNNLIDEGIKNRAEIMLANASADLAETLEEGTKSSYFPDIIAGAAYLAGNPNPYNGLSNQWGHDWVMGATLNYTLFNAGRRKNMVQAAKLEKEISALRQQEAKELIELEITNAYYDWKEAQKQAEIREKNVEYAREDLRISRDHYESGMYKSSELLKVQIMWQKAEIQLIEAESEVQKKRRLLMKTIGKIY